MKTSPVYSRQLSVPQWRPHFVLTLLLAVIISACGGGGGVSVPVNQVGFGSATLSWTPPTQNTDGSPLTDLAGYKFYWGTTPGIYPNMVMTNNPGITIYVIENLEPGTYEFVATAFNAAGVDSAYSGTSTKTIP